MNILAVRKNVKYLYSYTRVGMFLYGFTRCAQFDEQVKSYAQELPEGTQICLSVFSANKYIICEKKDGQLIFELKESMSNNDSAYAMFKSIDLALPVLSSKLSFTDAFNQSRITLRGDTQLGMQFVKMLDIAQAYIASPIRRKKYLKKFNVNKYVAFKVKMAVLFRGLI